MHVADYSHPEFELQKETVENVLSMLDISEELMRSKITVLNKVDLAYVNLFVIYAFSSCLLFIFLFIGTSCDLQYV